MRFYFLDASRGIAAFLVYIYHSNNLDNTCTNNFWVFVDFFFCLSGFVLAPRLKKSSKSLEGYIEFLLERFIRLAPIAITSLLLMFILNSHEDYSISDLVLALALIQVLFKKANEINLPLWSTSAELIVNALTPSLIRFFRFPYLVNFCIVFFVLISFKSESGNFGFNAICRCSIGFMLGYFTNKLVMCNKFFAMVIAITSLGFFAVFLISPIEQPKRLVLIDFIFCLFIYSLSSLENSLSVRNFGKVICNFLGMTSYAVYAFQIPFKVVFDASLFSRYDHSMDQWFLVLVASSRYILLVTFSFYFTKYFDIPIRGYLRSKIGKWGKSV